MEKLSKPKIKADVFDILMGLFCPVAIYEFIEAVLMEEKLLLVSGIYLLFFLVASVYVSFKQKSYPLKAFPVGISCVLIGLTPVLHGYGASFISVLVLIPLSLLYCILLTGGNKHSLSSYLFFADTVDIAFDGLIKGFSPYFSIISLLKSKKGGGKKLSKLVPVMVGVLCALPVLVVVFSLLFESDAAFEYVAGGFADKIYSIIGRVFFSDVDFFFWGIACILSFYIFSMVFSLRHRAFDCRLGESLRKSKNISPSGMAGFLGAVSAVYVVYLLSQTAYFFSAFGGKVPEELDFTLSEYAVRGFWEMMCVAFINLGLIGIGGIFCKRNEDKINPIIRGISLFLCLFTEVLIVTSMSKIILYIFSYGLTEKRFLSFLGNVILFLAFIAVAVRLFKKDFPYMKIVAAFSVAVVTLAVLIGSGRVITQFNAWAYISGYTEKIDLEIMEEYSDYDVLCAYERLISADKKDNITKWCKAKVGSIYKSMLREENKSESLSEYLLAKKLKSNAERYETYYKEFTLKYHSHSDFSLEYGDACFYEVYLRVDTDTPVTALSLYCDNETTAVQPADGSAFERGEILTFKVPGEFGMGIYETEFTFITENGDEEK